MSERKNKYIYEFADEKDGEEISALLENVPFQGDISLSYARRPNAILAAKADFEKTAFVIAKNQQTNKICGVGACSIYKTYVNNQIVNTAYLGGLRGNSNLRMNIIKAYNMVKEFCKENEVKYTYTTILKDNIYAKNMLTKSRKNMPDYIKLSDYTVYVLMKNIKFHSENVCVNAQKEDFEKLKEFINKEAKNRTFFPYFDLKDTFFGLNYKDFYILKDKNNNILACGVLWNQCKYKQLIVKHYSIKYKIVRFLATPILKLLKYPKLPAENEVINYSTLSFVLVRDSNPEILNDFIKQISNKVKEDFFVYASTEILTERIAPMEYKSEVYLVDWEKTNQKEDLKTDKMHIECALL